MHETSSIVEQLGPKITASGVLLSFGAGVVEVNWAQAIGTIIGVCGFSLQIAAALRARKQAKREEEAISIARRKAKLDEEAAARAKEEHELKMAALRKELND